MIAFELRIMKENIIRFVKDILKIIHILWSTTMLKKAHVGYILVVFLHLVVMSEIL